jgi:signal transduction histidine kinase
MVTAGFPRPAAAGGPAPPLVTRLILVEIGLTALEVLWVGAPLMATARALGLPVAITPAVLALALALWLASVLRLTYGVRPVLRLIRAREQHTSIAAAHADAAQRTLTRAPVEGGVVRAAAWLAVAALAVLLANSGTTRPISRLILPALLASALLHAAGAGAFRGLILGEALGAVRAYVFPTLEGMRVWSAAYRAWLMQQAIVVLGLAHAQWLLLVMTVANLTPEQRAVTTLLLWPVLLPGLALWTRSLAGRVRPIESYFDVTLRSPGTRGPARDEPRAVGAFLAAQSLPYRLGSYQGFVVLLAGVTAVAAARRVWSLPLPAAVFLLGGLALVVAVSGLYLLLLGRHVLRGLMRHLGSRHALPVAEIRSRFGLRGKLMVVFTVLSAATAGLVALSVVAPPGRGRWVAAAVALGAAAVVGLVWLISREVVLPIRALEARSEEMARGELARPLPPSGEADEIGRLAVAFEEMRRALRDRLRSTESINIDLEREVRRRTEALEARNAELREALEKLKRAQDNLVRSEKLASMGRLVAGIAHEINNPVNAVINTLGPLEETLRQIAESAEAGDAAQLGRGAEEMLAVMKRGATRTKAIVQALHNYSRGDDSGQREVVLARSIDDSLDLLRHRLRNVQVVKELEPGVRMVGLPGQIDQVLMNLITNAAQALGDKGGTIRVGARERADGIEVWVTDDGPGIPPDVLPRIFDPFFTTKDVGEGSGLGLSIVHGIVDRHGGKIDVESAPGKGTRFRMLFPPLAAAKTRVG